MIPTKQTIQISRVVLETPFSGRIELASDWNEEVLPSFILKGEKDRFLEVSPSAPHEFGLENGFFGIDGKVICFCIRLDEIPEDVDDPIYIGGSFNRWGDVVGQPEWELERGELHGVDVLLWKGPIEILEGDTLRQFKFITASGQWLEASEDATNLVYDGDKNRNHQILEHCSGRHWFSFALSEKLDLSVDHQVDLAVSSDEESGVTLRPGKFFYELKSDLEMGAIVSAKKTVFRLFAPRAKWVKVGVFTKLENAQAAKWHDLHRLEDGAWELTLDENLHGCFYWYRLDGPHNEFGHFDGEKDILDPYALASVNREGPGIILGKEQVARRDRPPFKTPFWQDLVITEAHVRDLIAEAPIEMSEEERFGFSGLLKWIQSPIFYPGKLGVNAIELQPVQAFDRKEGDEYHWGYMPVNYFSPDGGYGLDSSRGSAVTEFQEVVDALHERGFSVILDVVYNHVGEPNHLLFIDKLYYFEIEQNGDLKNWSGCGNDLRCRSAMSRRLIIDSLLHFIRFYRVDGFRFDLAELIGVEVLQEVEEALKAICPEVVLIAEPWSFKGHIAKKLRKTGFASWNDSYRDFLRAFVGGHGDGKGAEYFLKGSPVHFASWPAQTINYVESHDDEVWIDIITENEGKNGFLPTFSDVRRTHLMVAYLMMSLGVPMLHSGQDFMRSKHGVHNTYLRGDLNALDYNRLLQFSGTHAYFANWIKFRLSGWGELVRLYSPPSDGYFSFNFEGEKSSFAVVYNADGSFGERRLLFAINPYEEDAYIPLGNWKDFEWQQIADNEVFLTGGSRDLTLSIRGGNLYLPPLGCGLWVIDSI
jgi:pullulanase/glycogen debranching enzyme